VRTRGGVKRRRAPQWEFEGGIRDITVKLQAFFEFPDGLSLAGEAQRRKEKFDVRFQSDTGKILGHSTAEIPADVKQITVKIVSSTGGDGECEHARGYINWGQDEAEASDKVELVNRAWEDYHAYIKGERTWDDLGWREHDGIVYREGSPMQEAVESARLFASMKGPVLLVGEPGTGKELLAQLVWKGSRRSDKPHAVVNCGQFKSDLAGVELFGSVRGAFTGAVDKPGLFEVHDNGTLILDEIGDLPKGVQVQLLRVLENGEVRRVGSNTVQKVDVRVIAATNKKLEREVKQDNFREDLYDRLTGTTIRTVPLRQRLNDIPALVAYFCERYQQEYSVKSRPYSESLFKAILWYPWPGNVRQLQRFVEDSQHAAGNRF